MCPAGTSFPDAGELLGKEIRVQICLQGVRPVFNFLVGVAEAATWGPVTQLFLPGIEECRQLAYFAIAAWCDVKVLGAGFTTMTTGAGLHGEVLPQFLRYIPAIPVVLGIIVCDACCSCHKDNGFFANGDVIGH